MIGRIVRPVDFERVLAAPQRSRSTHFAVHYLCGSPLPARQRVAEATPGEFSPELSPELSTGGVRTTSVPVDDSGLWLGLVVPKRHAKRAVTRNLIKRQLRAAMVRHAPEMPAGLWVLRLRAGFDAQRFSSPSSEPLRQCAREEIAELLRRAVHEPLPPRRHEPGVPPRTGRSRRAQAGKPAGAAASSSSAAPSGQAAG